MGLGPVAAIRRALDRAGITLDQVDVIEINEAFAPQVLGCLVHLGLADDDTRINPGGGAIALGHPLGASGTRLLLTAARRLQASGGTYAVVAMCIGLGQGIAAVIRRT
jgi:acetyl-CoA C-acetyltransferase